MTSGTRYLPSQAFLQKQEQKGGLNPLPYTLRAIASLQQFQQLDRLSQLHYDCW